MAKEVMLLENVAELGREGEIVKVADGYARNYLLPKRLAAPVNNATRKYLAKRERERAASEKDLLQAAKELAKRLEQASCTIAVKTGKDDKLFGAVHVGHVLSSLAGQGIEVAKEAIQLDEPIDELGVFEIPVKLHPDVIVALKVWIVKE